MILISILSVLILIMEANFSLILFLICLLDMNEFSILNFLFIAIETILIKSIIIPRFLGGLIRRTKEYRDTEANIHHFYSLFISTVILFVGFLISNLNLPAMKLINPLYFGVSIAVIIITKTKVFIKTFILSVSFIRHCPTERARLIISHYITCAYICKVFFFPIRKKKPAKPSLPARR